MGSVRRRLARNILGCWLGRRAAAPMVRREMPPAIGPAAAGKAAIDEYDANHDSVISGDELKACPGAEGGDRPLRHRRRRQGDGRQYRRADREMAGPENGDCQSEHRFSNLTGGPCGGRDHRRTGEIPRAGRPPATATTDAYGTAVTARFKENRERITACIKSACPSCPAARKRFRPSTMPSTELGLEFAPDSPEQCRGGFVFHLKSK